MTTTYLLALEVTDEMAREYYQAVTGTRCRSEAMLDRAKHQLEVARDLLGHRAALDACRRGQVVDPDAEA